ncbi:MAG TPA: nitrous oxide reductase accessory protein NosL [Kofleriaceae bacterium]|nr:nitrous oxide reductase accessory protein NosL [Kofleriaceae bacterium]
MRGALVAAAALVLIGASCSRGGSGAAEVELHAEPIDGQECGACGMIVREQSAARAQLVHRDGTRHFFCSIGDLLAYLEAPSPHGAVRATYVETLDPNADPREFEVAPRPWVPAESAHFVTGVAKPRVMGRPVLVFETAETASAAATQYGGTVVPWRDLRL